MEHNLAKYLARHPECEVYCGQDQGAGRPTCEGEAENRRAGASAKPRAGPIQKRVTLWHKVQKRKVVGNAAPLEKNVHAYLAKHPEYEIYDAHGHEKEKDTQRSVEKVLTAIVTSVVALNRDLDERNRPNAASRKRKNQKHVSGGKRPKVGDRSTAASVPQDDDNEEAQEVVEQEEEDEADADDEGEEQEEEEEEEEEEPLAGLSYLLQIATNTVRVCTPDTLQTANEKDVAGGLLDLLVQATASAAVEAHSALKPESPPFSPMAAPTLTESTKMEVLSLAPSSVQISSVASFHRLS